MGPQAQYRRDDAPLRSAIVAAPQVFMAPMNRGGHTRLRHLNHRMVAYHSKQVRSKPGPLSAERNDAVHHRSDSLRLWQTDETIRMQIEAYRLSRLQFVVWHPTMKFERSVVS